MIAALAAEGQSIERAYVLLGVSHSGFYAWRTRPPSARSIRHAWLTDLITNIYIDSNGVYGAPRVRAELVHGHGITVGHNAVAMLMARAGLQGLPARRRHVRKPKLWTPGDLVDRQFQRAGPNELWVTDITEHPTSEGKIYYCVVLDAFGVPDAGGTGIHPTRRPSPGRRRTRSGPVSTTTDDASNTLVVVVMSPSRHSPSRLSSPTKATPASTAVVAAGWRGTGEVGRRARRGRHACAYSSDGSLAPGS